LNVTNWSREFIHNNWNHQDEEFNLHKDAISRALHWQMRTGKTKSMVDLACYLYCVGRIDGVLVLGPNNVHSNWGRREVPEHHWLGVQFTSMAWNTTASKNIGYDAQFGQLLDASGLAWYAINAEATVLKQQMPYARAFMKRRRFMLIVDEVHEWRRPGSKRSRYVRQHIAPKAVVRRNLSGTMIDNNPMHAYAQFEILKKGALGFTDYKSFEQYFGIFEEDEIWVGGRPRTIPVLKAFQNMDELRERMASLTSYVYRDQCEDLPKLLGARGEFELVDQQKRVYNEMVRGALVRLDTGQLVASAEGGALITRLQQVASGYAVDEDGVVHDLIEPENNPRLNYLVEEVKRCAGKVIVWCRYRRDIEMVMARMKKEGLLFLDYYGGTKSTDRVKHEDRFRNDPKVKGIAAQPKACGQGLDFSAGQDIIHYSHLHGDLIARRQADERCTKMGGKRVGVLDMVARGTVDERILQTNDDKANQADYLTGEGLREWLKIV
jgi:SNF2 family DNA or RNA helicase